MAKWSLKNRNNQTDGAPQMPPELSDYYNAEKRDRAWATWLLGFATLVVTILLAVLLFLGGRWVVNQFTDDEVDAPTTTQEESDGTATDDTQNGTAPDTGTAGGTDDQSVAGNNDQSDEASEENGVVTDEAAVTDEPLPDTGPGDVVALFVAVSMLGALTHNHLQRQKSHS